MAILRGVMSRQIITRKIELIKDVTCTGCMACLNVCPVGAISMQEDARGFYKPNIDRSKCINCGLCDKTCPILNQNSLDNIEPILYAMWAKDEIRLASSSGGAFTILSEEILNRGGVIFGAAWDKDFMVVHKKAENEQELQTLKKSKYVQSFIGNSFRQVEMYLLQNRWVLFVGTGCQIGGLKSYIKNKNIDDSKLILVDLWCYNIPPLKTFKKYIKDNWGDSLESFEFRTKKDNNYCSHYFTIKQKDSPPITIQHMSFWFKAYFSLMYECEACTRCKFQGAQRYGDISLGDFWGIENHDKTWNDGLGTSMVQVNTIKGKNFLDSVKDKCKRLEQVPLNWIREGQGNGKKQNVNQALFYDMIDQDIPFNKAVEMSMAGKKYDIGFCCVQVYNNFGSGITNYALYKILKDYNQEVLIITQPKSSQISPMNKTYFRKFPFPREDCAKFYNNKEEMRQLNKICNKFLVGSDQMFNSYLYPYIDDFIKLDWVNDDHEKLSYATSFGADTFFGKEDEKRNFKKAIRRFDWVSVREESAVEIMKDKFQILATQVLDPVFLCKTEHYLSLINPYINEIPKGKCFCYILDPDKDKEKFIQSMRSKSNLELFILSDLANTPEYVMQRWNLKTEFLKTNEEWLTSVHNSSYVIADSFHGLCFALIFEKPFIILHNERRGDQRVISLLKLIGYENRLVDATKDYSKISELLNEKINFSSIKKVLNEQIKQSRNWLESHIINKD